jgi:hypothetical protein
MLAVVLAFLRFLRAIGALHLLAMNVVVAKKF